MNTNKRSYLISFYGLLFGLHLLLSACSSPTPLVIFTPTSNIANAATMAPEILDDLATELSAVTPTLAPPTSVPATAEIAAGVPATPTKTAAAADKCANPAPSTPADWMLAYVGQGKLWLKDGKKEPVVLSDQSDLIDLKLSPDGQKAVFARQDPASGFELWSIHTDGSGLQQISSDQSMKGYKSVTLMSFSADGKLIAFQAYEEYSHPELWVADLEGARSMRLVSLAELKSFKALQGKIQDDSWFSFWVNWIPGTHRLIYIPEFDYEYLFDPTVWVDADTGEFGEYLPEGQGGMVAFSPDADKFVVSGSSSVTLRAVEDQAILAQISYPDIEYRGSWVPRPAWTPDSTAFSIALPSDEPGANELDYTVIAPVTIWKVPVGEPGPTVITKGKMNLGLVSFSPDREFVAFSSWDTIYFVDQSGSEVKRFTVPADGVATNLYDWSPDSRHFVSYVATGSDMGYITINDLCGVDKIRLYKEPIVLGLLPSFMGWLDTRDYLYIEYDESAYDTPDFAKLVLAELGGEETSWPVDFIPGRGPAIAFVTP